MDSAAKDFITDAFNHLKYIAYNFEAQSLIAVAGINPDKGIIEIKSLKDIRKYIESARNLKLWERE